MLCTICFASTANAGNSKPVYKIEKNEPNEIQVRITLPDYTKKAVQVNGKTFYIIQMPDATPILEKGAPDLYKYGGSFAIPENVTGQVEIVSSKFADETGVAVAPSKGNLYRTTDPSTIPFTFGSQYSENKFYPAQAAALEDQYNLRQIHGQRFSLYAVQYNPVTQTLRHYSEIVVRIHMQSTNKSALAFPSGKIENSTEFMEIYKNQFINFKNSGYERAVASKTVNETGPMLVLCYKSFMTAMQPFIDWKKQNGMQIKMVDAATAGSTPEAIKSYIGNAYQTKHIAFVLLVGDAPQIPTMKLSSGPSDNGYTYQDGNDRYPDLLIGRFSAETEADVKTQVNRSVNYEKNFASTKSWRLKGIGIASNQGPGDNNEMDWEHERNIRTLLMNYKYTGVAELYDGTHGGQDKSGNPRAFGALRLHCHLFARAERVSSWTAGHWRTKLCGIAPRRTCFGSDVPNSVVPMRRRSVRPLGEHYAERDFDTPKEHPPPDPADLPHHDLRPCPRSTHRRTRMCHPTGREADTWRAWLPRLRHLPPGAICPRSAVVA